ncbi:muramoyltetrapeptide carboxypeptidase [Rosenbergiella sp. S61]|uniref:Muramoyltetrapeptide carboxypeptidase n=1 Tax=Rosenbergiella gaditana TaxID=2726987 RepID=A0ABS5STC7_9GAMM|nr:muramoyltetrapeptide carboxypeptidase [Rosenbergiella gaditana]MBT0723271.1 muramoyltetrapeptide carboxypeptidase [Rosenbergiella gaditana]
MSTSRTIRLIAPSGYCQNQLTAERALERLSRDHQLENTAIITRRAQRFAGTDAERLNDINELVTLADLPDIILAVRGGYGVSRLLADVDYAGLKARLTDEPALLCGHSDFTALQLALLAKSDLVTFSGPMLAGNFGAETLSSFTDSHFWGVLSQSDYSLSWQDSHDLSGTWQGKLWGGNLAMICSLIGTPWLPKIVDGILVIEDINESPFRVERMLLQLYNSGILAQQKAVITGSFTRGEPTSYDAGYQLDTVWDYLQQKSGIPFINHLDYGHNADTVTLPIGAQATLIAQEKQRQLHLTGYPFLQP